MMKVVVTELYTCKATVKSSPPTNQHPVFLQARCPSCHPTNSVRALKGCQWAGKFTEIALIKVTAKL